jgi:hypothetical protein
MLGLIRLDDAVATALSCSLLKAWLDFEPYPNYTPIGYQWQLPKPPKRGSQSGSPAGLMYH